MSHNITVEGGTSVRLPTAGKYCDRDIIITAKGGTPTPTQEKTINITTNGTHTVIPDNGYALSKVTASVNVTGEAPNIQPLEITENGTYTAPDGVDGYSPITVNVASGGGGEVNMNKCTVVIDVPSKTNYYVCSENVSSGAITYGITKHYTDANITKTVRCDSVMNIVAGTIKGATVTDGEVLRVVSGQGLVYKTPNTDGASIQITLTS